MTKFMDFLLLPSFGMCSLNDADSGEREVSPKTLLYGAAGAIGFASLLYTAQKIKKNSEENAVLRKKGVPALSDKQPKDKYISLDAPGRNIWAATGVVSTNLLAFTTGFTAAYLVDKEHVKPGEFGENRALLGAGLLLSFAPLYFSYKKITKLEKEYKDANVSNYEAAVLHNQNVQIHRELIKTKKTYESLKATYDLLESQLKISSSASVTEAKE